MTLPAGNPVIVGTTILDTWANTTMNDIANELTNSLPRDGSAPPTANVPMGGYKLTGSAVATLATDLPQYQQIQSGASTYLTGVAGTNTITASLSSPALVAYAAGNSFKFISAGANTGAVTININGIGAKSITKNGATALVTGDILSGATIEITYDGTQFQLVSISATQVMGSVTNDSAPAGYIGEYISSDLPLASAASCTNGVAANVTSITLSAGDWDVSGNVTFTPAATTNQTVTQCSLSSVSATSDTTLGRQAKIATQGDVTGGQTTSVNVGRVRFSLATSTTIYLVRNQAFTVSTMTAYGNISARRVR